MTLQVLSLHFLLVSKRLDHLAQDEKRGWQKKTALLSSMTHQSLSFFHYASFWKPITTNNTDNTVSQSELKSTTSVRHGCQGRENAFNFNFKSWLVNSLALDGLKIENSLFPLIHSRLVLIQTTELRKRKTNNFRKAIKNAKQSE